MNLRTVTIVVLVLSAGLVLQPAVWADDDAIMDSDNINFSGIFGNWQSSSWAPCAVGGSYYYAFGSDDTIVLETPQTADISGQYAVYARWTSHANRNDNARYRIYDGTSTLRSEVYVDQREDGCNWQWLDTVILTKGNNGNVILDNPGATGGEATIADGIRFVRISKDHNDIVCAGNDANDIMVEVGPICVDKYEASVWSDPNGDFTQYGASSDNYPCNDNANDCINVDFLDDRRIYARSEAGVTPSRYITWFQAQQACAMSGKRLLTNAEWQMAAAGTPDLGADNLTTDCAVGSPGPVFTGSRSDCVSNWRVNDMVGNAWEWVADWMQGNTNPWAPSTGTTNAAYGSDWMIGINPAQSQGSGQNFPAALVRGGGWWNLTGAGVFSFEAREGPSDSSSTIGFRCAR